MSAPLDALAYLPSWQITAEAWLLMAAIYIAPSLVAWGTTRFLAIAAANLLLGWTVIGWILTLIWAIAEQCSKKPTPPPYP